jgi:hypothetical protein
VSPSLPCKQDGLNNLRAFNTVPERVVLGETGRWRTQRVRWTPTSPGRSPVNGPADRRTRIVRERRDQPATRRTGIWTSKTAVLDRGPAHGHERMAGLPARREIVPPHRAVDCTKRKTQGDTSSRRSRHTHRATAHNTSEDGFCLDSVKACTPTKVLLV